MNRVIIDSPFWDQPFWIATLAMSGPMERSRQERLQSGNLLSISVPRDFFSKVIESEPSWSPLIETVLKASMSSRTDTKLEIVCQCSLDLFERNKWEELVHRAELGSRFEFKADASLKPPSLYDWSVEVFPKSFLKIGELVWRRELEDYQTQLAPTFASMNALRFWPGHLRRKANDTAALANYELSFAEATFSPQDDRQGSGPNALLNPTLQISNTLAIWRLDSEVYERDIHWQEAAVIDELRENPRVSFASLESELESHAFPFNDRSAFQPVIERLVNDGLILRR